MLTMNKKLTGIIPNIMALNTWRGILRYGFFRSFKLMHKLKYETTIPKYYLTICAIAKNEGAYFQEWIEHHHKLGIEKFYIYDNESEDNTKEVLTPYIESGLVDYTFFPGKAQQLPAYDHCIDKHRLEAHWIAFVDIDEFIVPIKDRTIPAFLKRFENVPAVEINWLIYGSGGAEKKETGGVIERFKHHADWAHTQNRYVKSIINPRQVFYMIGAHKTGQISGRAADSHGNPIKKNFHDREPQHDVIRINHYAVKSYEEFLVKYNRGRVIVNKPRSLDYFKLRDLNDIKEE